MQRKKSKKFKEKKPYTPFPPEQLPRKIDIQMAEGKVPVNPKNKEKTKDNKKKHWKSEEKKNEVKETQKRKRSAMYEAPDETVQTTKVNSSSDVNIEKLKKKVKHKK